MISKFTKGYNPGMIFKFTKWYKYNPSMMFKYTKGYNPGMIVGQRQSVCCIMGAEARKDSMKFLGFVRGGRVAGERGVGGLVVERSRGGRG